MFQIDSSCNFVEDELKKNESRISKRVGNNFVIILQKRR